MKNTLPVAFVLALSSAALAAGGSGMSQPLNARGTMPLAPAVADRAGTQVDVTLLRSVNSFGAFGDAGNFVESVNLPVTLGPGETIVITGIGWDVTLTAFEPSFIEEMAVDIRDPGSDGGVGLAPGVGYDDWGTESFANEVVKLADAQIQNIALTGTAVEFEFYELFDDLANENDGFWILGSVLTIQYQVVPTPGSAALLGLAGLVGLRRRR